MASAEMLARQENITDLGGPRTTTLQSNSSFKAAATARLLNLREVPGNSALQARSFRRLLPTLATQPDLQLLLKILLMVKGLCKAFLMLFHVLFPFHVLSTINRKQAK